MSVETQIVVTLHYLADEGRMTKVSNSFGLEKATVQKSFAVLPLWFQKNLDQVTYYFLKRRKKLKSMPETFTIDIVSLNALVLLTVHI